MADDDGTWADLLGAVHGSSAGARLVPADPGRAAETLLRLQVTTRSVLGALAFHCGGLVVDHGWLRILGGGGGGLPDLAAANGLGAADAAPGPPAFLVVAFDVVGGRFAVDGGGLGIAAGEVCYWGPDSLSWTGLGAGHAAFVDWALDGQGLGEFYASLRWDGWEREVGDVPLSQGMSIYPPPFTAEGRRPASRRPVPFTELLEFYDDMARQLAGG